MNIFIIPGNPPAKHFYQLWAKEIKHVRNKVSVFISSYPQLKSSNNSHSYLNDAASFHGHEYLKFCDAVKGKAILMGHSVGAWMALRLLEKHHAVIDQCILLYPFLKRPSLKGRFILKSARYLYKIPRFERFVLKHRSRLEKVFKDLGHVTDEELRTSLSLAYHEHEVIGCHNKTLQIPEHLRQKLHTIYCDQDTWCPTQTINEMKQWISCEKIATTHGFITSAQERAIVLKALQKFIK